MGGRRLHTPTAPQSPSSGLRRGTTPRVRSRSAAAHAATGFAALIAVAACSPEARHGVLVFLYDGVPPLDAADGDDAVDLPGDSASADAGAQRRRPTYYTHPHFWENRCGSCHDAGGRLLQTVRQGLCMSCHFQKPEEKKKRYHGPVAVNDCLACHRLHRSRYEKILLADAQTLCTYCHETEELTQDKHHATMDKEPCGKCHDPHGGDDRFFLLPGARTTDSSQDGLILEPTP